MGHVRNDSYAVLYGCRVSARPQSVLGIRSQVIVFRLLTLLLIHFSVWVTFYAFRRCSANNMNARLPDDERKRMMGQNPNSHVFFVGAFPFVFQILQLAFPGELSGPSRAYRPRSNTRRATGLERRQCAAHEGTRLSPAPFLSLRNLSALRQSAGCPRDATPTRPLRSTSRT
jgi:hypothetical protein